MDKVFKFAAAAGVVYIVAVLITRETVKSAADTVASVNEGTPFEGFGPIGTLGNATDKVLFGLPSRLGSFIGNKIADLQGL